MDAAVAAAAGEEVTRQHRRFLTLFGLEQADCPMLELDRYNWVEPFALVSENNHESE